MNFFKHKNNKQRSYESIDASATLPELEAELATVTTLYDECLLARSNVVRAFRSGAMSGPEYTLEIDVLSFRLANLLEQKNAVLVRIDSTVRSLGLAALRSDAPR